MVNLSKKTRVQLEEMAQDLGVSLKNCKVKQDVLNKIAAHLVEHFSDYDKDHEYYEYAYACKVAGPEAFTSPVKKSDSSGVPSAAESIEVEDITDGETESESESSVEAITKYTLEEEEDENDDTEDEDEDEEFVEEQQECKVLTILKKNEKIAGLIDYLSDKNYELRDYLSDPFTINDLTVAGESIFLLSHFVSLVSVSEASFVPQVIKDNLPAQLLKLSIADASTLADSTFWSTLLLWLFVSFVLPKTASYYVNFTYNFEYDPFIFALSKLLFGLILFKTEIQTSDIRNEVDFQFTPKELSYDYATRFFRHNVLKGTILLRAYFGNWALIGGIFTTFIALYANLSFI